MPETGKSVVSDSAPPPAAPVKQQLCNSELMHATDSTVRLPRDRQKRLASKQADSQEIFK